MADHRTTLRIDPVPVDEARATTPGSLGGELLRSYWHPFAAAQEVADRGVVPIRIMSEDLVAFRTGSGEFGLVQRHCAHRGADLVYGLVGEKDIRCSYHGWCFDAGGRCTSQPFEDETSGPSERFRETAQLLAYPVVEHAGLLWCYMGSGEAPQLPNWELFEYEDGFRQISLAVIPCNWYQCQENSIDPVHFEWLHNTWAKVQAGQEPNPRRHTRVGYDDFDYGLYYHRIMEGEHEASRNWRLLRLCIMPNLFIPVSHCEYRVPIDDFNTLSVVWHFTPVPLEREPYRQEVVPYWWATTSGPNGEMLASKVLNQDFTAWAGQGRIADQRAEHLARSDRGVVMFRKLHRQSMEAVANGKDPVGVVRGAGRVSEPLALPPADRRSLVAPRLRREDWLAWMVPGTANALDHVVGMPPHVREMLEDAVGVTVEEWEAAWRNDRLRDRAMALQEVAKSV